MLKKIKDETKKLFFRRKSRNRFAIKTNNVGKKPRLSVFKSNQHIYAQIIDDEKSATIVSVSTKSKDISSKLNSKNSSNIEAAKIIGQTIADKALKAKITEVVFDRGAYAFHGKIKALADAAKEQGLKI